MEELLFTIKRNHSVPMYQQVYLFIKKQIESGQLKKGTKLPSVRQLAELLGVSRNTTQIAYEQLLAEGYLRSALKKGYYVQATPLSFFPQTAVDEKQLQIPEQDHKITIDFRPGMVDTTYFPLSKWRALSNKVLQEPLIYEYGDPQGDPLLRASLADYLFQSRGVQTTADHIIIGSSTQQQLLLLSLLLKNQRTEIAVEDPGYNGAREIFSLQSYTIIPIPVSKNGVDVTKLQQSKA